MSRLAISIALILFVVRLDANAQPPSCDTLEGYSERVACYDDKEELKQKSGYYNRYDNCIVDKMPVGARGALRRATERACRRIAENPSLWERFKYD